MYCVTGSCIAAIALAVASAVEGQTDCSRPGGPDLIVGAIPDQPVGNYTAEESNGIWIDAFSFPHTQCNVGDANLHNAPLPSVNHPLWAQHLYRMTREHENSPWRIEHIGLSWVMHANAALMQNACSCSCNGTGGSLLGAGCSDPHSSTFVGTQAHLRPRWQHNFFDGTFPSQLASPSIEGTTVRRLRVRCDELSPSDANTIYVAEYLYASAHDASLGRQNNNASYRSVTITGGPNEFAASISSAGPTVRESSAIRAWKTSDPDVVETDIQLPDEGLFILAAKATHVAGNIWRYEYALANVNSDWSGQAFRVPLPPASVITDIGFHDVEYHGGDAVNNLDDPNLNISGEDWEVTITPDAIQWASETYEQNFNANALRWGTMYNFRFNLNRAPSPPHAGQIALTTFKVTSEAHALTVTPAAASCAADISPIEQPDGTINVNDLLAVINAWGPCVPGNYAADISGDGVVNVNDLLAVIDAWGPCPK